VSEYHLSHKSHDNEASRTMRPSGGGCAIEWSRADSCKVILIQVARVPAYLGIRTRFALGTDPSSQIKAGTCVRTLRPK
jgi:hypothetical protein